MAETLSAKPKKLSNDMSLWGAEIMAEIKSWTGLPAGTFGKVIFSKRDKETGAALGTLVLIVSGQPVNVPIVIKDFMLSPLDVMQVKGKFSPLTRRRINSLNSAQDSFAKSENVPLNRRGSGEDLKDTVVPPTFYRGIGKFSAEKHDYIVPKLMVQPSFPYKDILMREIDADSAESYYMNGTHDVLHSVIKKFDGSDEEQVVEVYGKKVVPIDPEKVEIIWIPHPSPEDARNGFVTVLAAGGLGFDPAMMQIPIPEMIHLYGNEHGIDPAYGGKVIYGVPDGLRSDVYANPVEGVKEFNLNETGRGQSVELLTKDKQMVSASWIDIILSLINPESPEEHQCAILQGDKLAVGDGDGCVYGKIISHKIVDLVEHAAKNTISAEYCLESLGGSHSKPVNVIFSCVETKKAIGPIEIESLTETFEDIGGEDTPVSIFTGTCSGYPVKVLRSSMFDDVGFSKDGEAIEIFLPTDYRAKQVRVVVDLCDSPAEIGYIAKLAADAAGDWMSIESSDGGYTYKLDMPETVKSAYCGMLDKAEIPISFDSLTPSLAEFFVTASGVSQKQASVMVKAASEELVTVYGVKYLPVDDSRYKSASPQLCELNKKFANSIRCFLVKQASMMQDKQTVDAILGLGLASPENVDSFIEAMPKYQEIVEGLARLLISSRVSSSPLKSESIRQAMLGIENVLEQGDAYVSAKSVLDNAQMG